jgi:hypothetical protein
MAIWSGLGEYWFDDYFNVRIGLVDMDMKSIGAIAFAVLVLPFLSCKGSEIHDATINKAIPPDTLVYRSVIQLDTGLLMVAKANGADINKPFDKLRVNDAELECITPLRASLLPILSGSTAYGATSDSNKIYAFVQYLLAHGAMVDETTTRKCFLDKGKTSAFLPLEFQAVGAGKTEVLSLFLASGVDPNSYVVFMPLLKGSKEQRTVQKSLMHFAVGSPWSVEVARLLWNYKGRFDLVDEDGCTIYDAAIKAKDYQLVNYMKNVGNISIDKSGLGRCSSAGDR